MTASTTPPSVIPLLSSWEAYLKAFPQGNIHGFARWLLANSETATYFESSIPTLAAYANKFPGQAEVFVVTPIRRPNAPAAEPLPPENAANSPAQLQSSTPAQPQPATLANLLSDLDLSAQSTMLIVRLHRILAFLSKSTVKQLGFTKDLEFSVLVQVALMDRPNKKEVCRELLIEGSTGVEITKRLAKKGFLLEETDEKDRRSARLSLTEKGKKILQQGYQQLGAIHPAFLDTLNNDEKKVLVNLLTRLDTEHTRHIANLLPNA